MIRTIVFDFGNVVGYFDHRLVSRRLAAHSRLAEAELHASIFASALEDDYESGRLSTAEFLEQLRLKCRICCPEETIIAAYSEIFWSNPDIGALLSELKPRCRLMLGSNTNELHWRQFRRQFADVLSFFDDLVLSHEIGVRKPKPGFFEHCRRRANCPAHECLFIDDLPANIAAARACGWHGIVYTDFKSLRRSFEEVNIAVQ